MGSMRASPAALLLLALALICAVQMMKAAHGDDTVREAASRKVNARIAQETSGVSTTVVLGTARLSFSRQRCVSMPKKAGRKSVKVWWNGRGGLSNVGSGGEATGVACSQVKLFGKRGCQGKVVDSMVNPGMTEAMFPSSETKLRKGASVASVLCNVPEQQQEEEETPPEVIRDPACDALSCEPGGKCVVDGNGERYCKWDSSCGVCPTGATCKTVPARYYPSVQVPYCACPQGFGITETKCVAGGASDVSSYSMTLLANPAAKDSSSRPYTLRLNLSDCTQLPAAVAGKYRTIYSVENTDDGPKCASIEYFSTDNCEDDPVRGGPITTPSPFVAYFEPDVPAAIAVRSIWCTE